MEYEDAIPKTPPSSLTGTSVTVAPREYEGAIPKTPPPSLDDPSPPAATGNSFWYDALHPQPADLSRPQTWRDWGTKTYYPTATDYGNAAVDDVSMGSADYAQSKLSGEDIAKIRQRTAQSQAALGPMGPIVNAASYVAGPGKILGPLAAIGKGAKVGVKAGRAALEGFGAGAISSEGHDLGSDKDFNQRAWDAAKQGSESAVLGVGGNWLGRGTARVFRPGFDAAQGAPGRTGDLSFYDMRKASAQGQNISPAVEQFQRDTGHDMSGVLAAQKVGTGPMSDLTRQASNWATRGAAGYFQPLTWFSSTPGKIGEGVHDVVMNRVRNYATQKAFDQIYPNVAGSPLHADTSGWVKAIQQGMIGGSLP